MSLIWDFKTKKSPADTETSSVQARSSFMRMHVQLT